MPGAGTGIYLQTANIEEKPKNSPETRFRGTTRNEKVINFQISLDSAFDATAHFKIYVKGPSTMKIKTLKKREK